MAALPFLLTMLRKKKYQKSLPARFFGIHNKRLPASDIYMHICSYGEAIAVAPIVKHFDKAKWALSAITQTGFDALKSYGKPQSYLPYELFVPFWMQKHKVVVLVEAELWYMLVLFAKLKGAKVVLINARISDKSAKRYAKMRWFYAYIFKHIDAVFCQSTQDKERLEHLGARHVTTVGNIKLSATIKATKDLPKPKDKELIVAASTHEKEEALIVQSYKPQPNKVLVVVPRHPERFESVHMLLESFAQDAKLSYHRYSQQPNFESDVVLVDTMGELINIYAISDVVILGGGFAKVGGHNPLEPATFNNKIISGHEIFNLKSLFSLVDGVTFAQNHTLDRILHDTNALPVARIKGSVDMQPIYLYIEREITQNG